MFAGSTIPIFIQAHSAWFFATAGVETASSALQQSLQPGLPAHWLKLVKDLCWLLIESAIWMTWVAC